MCVAPGDDDAQRRHQRLHEHLPVRRIDQRRSDRKPDGPRSRRHLVVRLVELALAIGDARRRPRPFRAFAPRIDDRIDRCAMSARVSGSTSTLIWPPHGSPARHAVSSLTPNSSSLRRAPLAITSAASTSTSTSTQPPDTEPSKRSSGATTSCPPTGTGAEPQVDTTVAMATLSMLIEPGARDLPRVTRTSRRAPSRVP